MEVGWGLWWTGECMRQLKRATPTQFWTVIAVRTLYSWSKTCLGSAYKAPVGDPWENDWGVWNTTVSLMYLDTLGISYLHIFKRIPFSLPPPLHFCFQIYNLIAMYLGKSRPWVGCTTRKIVPRSISRKALPRLYPPRFYIFLVRTPCCLFFNSLWKYSIWDQETQLFTWKEVLNSM